MAVEEALRRVLESASRPADTEWVPLARAAGRTLSRDLAATRTQPPTALSAMDGYAVRSGDVALVPSRLRLIGESAAGRGFGGIVGPGEAARIFTGAPMPAGADAVLLQEDARIDEGAVVALEAVAAGRHVRPAGLDFREGQVCLRAGRRLGAAEVALAAAMNHPALPVARKPRVAILATGDELVAPGTTPGADQIVASNHFAVAAMTDAAGGEVIDLGIARDDIGDLSTRIKAARTAGADLLVTLGGASVGDHDLVQRALLHEGMALDFWRVAMRPGKPLMHGAIDGMQVLGLPGNPVSAFVCGVLFLVPLVRAMNGDAKAGADPTEPATLGAAVPPNDGRQDYVRARLTPAADGGWSVVPGPTQDSSLLRALAEADCLLVRPPYAAAAAADAMCRVIRLGRP